MTPEQNITFVGGPLNKQVRSVPSDIDTYHCAVPETQPLPGFGTSTKPTLHKYERRSVFAAVTGERVDVFVHSGLNGLEAMRALVDGYTK